VPASIIIIIIIFVFLLFYYYQHHHYLLLRDHLYRALSLRNLNALKYAQVSAVKITNDNLVCITRFINDRELFCGVGHLWLEEFTFLLFCV